MKKRHTLMDIPSKARTSLATVLVANMVLAGLVAGCGGSGTSPPQQNLEPQTPPTGAVIKAGGIWSGSWTNGPVNYPSSLVSGVIAEDHSEGRFLSVNGQMLVLRNIFVADGRISADVSAFARPHSPFFGDNMHARGVLTGTIAERSHIVADFYLSSGDKGRLEVYYDDLYERGSDIAWLAGVWETSHGITYNIDALGEIFAQTENGCVHAGQVSLIDGAWNVYRVRIVDHCLIAEATGLGILTDDAIVLMLDLADGWFITEILAKR